jgi:hypothetical protein
MNTKFKSKETGEIVQYFGPIQHVTNRFAEEPNRGYVPVYTFCVELYNKTKDCVFVMPLLEFINTYEPITKPIDDIFKAMEHNIKQENEGDKEDIHTLHSGEPEVDPTTTPE